ncbi:hypothetical protein OEIGOIKO_03596 [Streptomyces chrestomyceticus JCM 4735]|uniref:Integral membrane protein n=1 Tax=Streptomyces chrestomyceticus JCM 4735 TaxID=1306181 RepID=A0A7U9KUX3_9ACTN|nr:DUF6796 family protein [Streptomyces chrestomyceticus]GCD35849.1 hypothetical protein OEIGOIKO_03596 [Streptomyces chrestomyceticus JCM 4735]
MPQAMPLSDSNSSSDPAPTSTSAPAPLALHPHTLRALRLAGIAGILTSVAWLVGDILLLGKPMGSPDQYPILHSYDGMARDSLAAMLPASTTRLAWGALLGVLTGPLYLYACRHFRHALVPQPRRLALPPFLLLTAGYALAPFAHGSFFYWGQAAKAVHESGADSAALTTLPGDLATVLFIPYAVLLILWAVGSVWLAVLVLRGGTAFPRWMCVANPLVCTLIGTLVTKLWPGAVGTALQGAALSVANLLLFSLTTAVFWRRKAG